MELWFIGTGAGGSPGSKRWRTSTLLIHRGVQLLVDCGVGCHYRLSEKGLLTELDAIFITHTHMDHFLGLPELLFQAHMEGRSKELRIVAPYLIKDVIALVAPNLFKNLGYKFTIEPTIDKGKTIVGDLVLKTFPACHNTASEAHSVIVDDNEGLSVGFTGDTTQPCSSILENFVNASVLIHEATCSEEYRVPCNYYGHSTNKQAIEAAYHLGCDNVILNHIDERYNSNAHKEAEIYSKMYGLRNVHVPDDMDVIKIN